MFSIFAILVGNFISASERDFELLLWKGELYLWRLKPEASPLNEDIDLTSLTCCGLLSCFVVGENVAILCLGAPLPLGLSSPA